MYLSENSKRFGRRYGVRRWRRNSIGLPARLAGYGDTNRSVLKIGSQWQAKFFAIVFLSHEFENLRHREVRQETFAQIHGLHSERLSGFLRLRIVRFHTF